MTEAEARKKWCPFSRVAHFDFASNRHPDGAPEREGHCLASSCMAWRTITRSDPDVHLGYCGLAGKEEA